jgi:hypothetical protein
MSENTMALERELAACEHQKSRLLAEAGKFVLIHGDDVAGVWDTYQDALRAGYLKYGVDSPFLVKRIDPLDRPQFFGRSLTCPS